MRGLIFAGLALQLSLLQSCGKRIPRYATEESFELASAVRTAERSQSLQLIHGFHGIEHNAWRWTGRRFAVTLKTPAGAAQQGGALTVHLSVPEPIIRHAGSVTLTATVSGRSIGQKTWTVAGPSQLLARVPADLLTASATTIDFELSSYLAASVEDARELGIIVESLELRTVD